MNKDFRLKFFGCCLVLLLAHTASQGINSIRGDGMVAVTQRTKLPNRVRKQFGFPLPSSAQIECEQKSDDRRVQFMCVRMRPNVAAQFKETLINFRRPSTQRFVYEDKDSGGQIGSIPAGNEPEVVKEWKDKNNLTGSETLIHIQNQKQVGENELKTLSYLVMFSSESKGLAYFYFYPAR